MLSDEILSHAHVVKSPSRHSGWVTGVLGMLEVYKSDLLNR